MDILFVKNNVIIFIFIILSGCSTIKAIAIDHEFDITYFDSTGKEIEENDVLKKISNSHYTIIGETHSNIQDHKIQANILKSIYEYGLKPSLGLEMVPHTIYSQVLSDYIDKKIPFEQLNYLLEWNQNWTYSINIYKNIFLIARYYRIPIYGLNIPQEIRKSISVNNGFSKLTKEQCQFLPSKIIYPLPEQISILKNIFANHTSMIKKSSLQDNMQSFKTFLLIQSIWDSSMAEQAIIYRKTNQCSPIIILAGSGHVEGEYGIAYRLKKLDPKCKIISILPFRKPIPDKPIADIYIVPRK